MSHRGNDALTPQRRPRLLEITNTEIRIVLAGDEHILKKCHRPPLITFYAARLRRTSCAAAQHQPCVGIQVIT